MLFIGALDAILVLAVAWELLYHFKNTTWHKPSCREGNNISDFEFMGRPSVPCLSGQITDESSS
jgi:hypothetical protein